MPKESIEKGGYTIIVGCGRLGADLANAFSNNDKGVIIIDDNAASLRKLSPSFGGMTIVGDATDIEVLREAGLSEASALVAVTNDDNINIMVAQMARELYHVPHIIARLYDSERECVYREFGIKTIAPSVLSAHAVEHLLGLKIIESD